MIGFIKGKYGSYKAQKLSKKLLAEARERMNDGGKHWVTGYMDTLKNGEQAHCSVGGIRRSLFGDRDISAEFCPMTEDEFKKVFDPEEWQNDDVGMNEFKLSVVTDTQYAAYRLALQTLVMQIRDGGFDVTAYTDEEILAAPTSSLESIIITWNDGRVGPVTWNDVDRTFKAAVA